ncbi:MAG: DUF2971 domain-containing protein [Lachnospiraceae bacterium]|nr:DUF2971 domain-containing protein [Lachnospiraceae bacterium]
MNSIERKKFWDALCNIYDNTYEHIQGLVATINTPEYLCRFRTVSESTLLQLQENKLYYSSADYYDDPFDTFIHVDYASIKAMYNSIKNLLDSENPNFINGLKGLENLIGISAEQMLNNLEEHSWNILDFPEHINQIRTIIQKNLFSICFCEDALNETLWLKYANNYKGFALVYDVKNDNTYLCGKEDTCNKCRSMAEKPSLYPVYYTEDTFDATKFALACMLWREKIPKAVFEFTAKAVMWDAERISLIKKKCHEYDQEWRMIRPTMLSERSYIKMKPYKVILGLRMPDYEKMLVVSAAKIAGINSIEELYINELDQLACRKFYGLTDLNE